MTTENARESILKSAQHLFEQGGRIPTVQKVRQHCGCSMREAVPVMIDWLDAQTAPHTTTESLVDSDNEVQYSQLLKPLAEAIEQMAIRAVNRATTHAARHAAVRGVVLDTVAATCDEQLSELEILRERLTAAESTASSIQVTAAGNERNAARREAELRQEIAFEQARFATAEDKIKELAAAAKASDAIAESRMSELTEARSAVDSHIRRMSTARAEQESLRARIASYEERIGDLTTRLAQLLRFEESVSLLCQQAATIHEHSTVVRVQLAGITSSLKPSLIEPGRPERNAKQRRATRTDVANKTG